MYNLYNPMCLINKPQIIIYASRLLKLSRRLANYTVTLSHLLLTPQEKIILIPHIPTSKIIVQVLPVEFPIKRVVKLKQGDISEAISAAPLRRNDPDSYVNINTRLEPGFDLTQEDMIKFHIWPKGTIPYYIDDFSFDKVLRDRIRVFLDGVNRLTSLNFVEIPSPPEDDETRWVLFLNRKGLLGCADHSFKNFTNEGVQKVVLGYHCMNSDENLAELVLSLVGVPPQHNAPNRDARVIIMKDNIIPDKLYLFEKLKDNEWLFHNLTYDFESAGHYGPYKHTSNGKITVRQLANDYYLINVFGPLTPKPKVKGFSSQDILKISMLYNYILRNRETPVPECSKLFAPGSKLSRKVLKKINLKEPRQKPSRYLGESEKEKVNNKQENDFVKNKNDEEMTDDYERNDDTEMNSENEKNNSNTDKKDKENSENDYGNNKIEKKVEKLNLHNFLNNSNKDYNYSKDNEDIDHNGSDDEENWKKLNEDNNMNGDKDENNLNNNSKEEQNEVNDGDKSEDKDIKIDDASKTSDREGSKSNENEKVNGNVTTSDSIVNTTRTRNNTQNMLLAHKTSNALTLKLLSQSDYESGDENKNKYIHEKNL